MKAAGAGGGTTRRSAQEREERDPRPQARQHLLFVGHLRCGPERKEEGMKFGRLILAVIVIVAVTGTAFAGPFNLPIKWSQRPNMETGIDYGSMRDWYVVADDFECQDPRPVVHVHWWGSYWSGQDPQPIKGF